MNKEDRRHGHQLLERFAAEQDGIECLLRQLEECQGCAESAALQEMLNLCITELKQRQSTIQDAFRFLLDLEDNHS